MNIRPATSADVVQVLPMVDAITKLHQAWDAARFTTRASVLESYRGWLTERASDPRSIFLVADAGEGLAGYLIGTIEKEIPIYWVPECGWIHDVWVEEGYRHEGLARQMTELAVEKFGHLGVKQVRLTTAAANEHARQLFTKCSFRPATIEMIRELSPVTANVPHREIHEDVDKD